VTTLLKNLFKEGSPLQLKKDPQGHLPLLDSLTDKNQVLAFKTLGALIGLASLQSLPLGGGFRSQFL
jgi:hypothetical protein